MPGAEPKGDCVALHKTRSTKVATGICDGHTSAREHNWQRATSQKKCNEPEGCINRPRGPRLPQSGVLTNSRTHQATNSQKLELVRCWGVAELSLKCMARPPCFGFAGEGGLGNKINGQITWYRFRCLAQNAFGNPYWAGDQCHQKSTNK